MKRRLRFFKMILSTKNIVYSFYVCKCKSQVRLPLFILESDVARNVYFQPPKIHPATSYKTFFNSHEIPAKYFCFAVWEINEYHRVTGPRNLFEMFLIAL